MLSSFPRRLSLAALLVVTTTLPLLAQAPALTQPLPVDPAVKIGTLPNGIRYYIRKNAKPEKRAELRLVINAGSLLEDDDQRGLAHFLEHTAFNGTRNFPKNELISYLESIGVRFGADLNAYTGFDQTVYILPVPTDTTRLVEKAFQILEDWAHGQVFDSLEIVRERGVVLEEWRGGRGAGERMLQQWLPIAFKGSRYAERLPIGTQASIETASPAALRRFYRDWYRPDLMSVVAVGDFDPAWIEGLIRRHFSSITAPATPRPRIAGTVPDNREPLIAVATDPEATSSSVEVNFKMPAQSIRTVGDYRRSLVERLFLGMLNSRFNEIAQKPDAPFLGAGASKGAFIARDREAFSLGAGVKDGGIAQGLQALLVEARRVEEHGFLASELDRERQDVLRAYERAHAEREKTNSSAYVEEYIGNFLEGEAIPGIEAEYRLAQQLLPTISLADVNALARAFITDENRVIIASAPRKAGVTVPTEAQLAAAFASAAQVPVTAYAETLANDALMPTMPAPGRVVSTRQVTDVGVTEWTLSNGVRVVVKPTDFKADEVRFQAFSFGGSSLAPDSMFMSATLAAPVVMQSGVGPFNMIDLGKKLSGKVASVSASIGATTEGLAGSASPKDLETLFQLIHLRFTAPRIDTAVFQAMQNQIAPMLANKDADPNSVFGDTVTVTMGQHHFRARPLTKATFAEVDPAEAYAFYRDRFADAGDFTFVFVGNVQLDTLRRYAEQYLATLPATGRRESWRNVGAGPPRGVVTRTVRKGTEPRATTQMFFTGPFEYTPESRFALRALIDVFQIKLNETLREQLGGTYSPNVAGGGAKFPRGEYTIQVGYSSAPDNVDRLAATVLALIDTLQRQGPSAADVDKVREQIIRAREVETRQNAFWVGNIAARLQHGEDVAGLGAAYDAMVKALTPAQLQAAAQRYLDTRNYARFTLLPEAPKPVP